MEKHPLLAGRPLGMRALLLPLAGGAVLVGGVLLLLEHFGLTRAVHDFAAWLDGGSAWAPLVFVLVMSAAVILLLPGAPLTLGAGFAFGLVEGSMYVVVGTTLGAAVAFGIARWLLSHRAAAWLRQHARLRQLDAGLGREGWKVVLLSRLVPFFPGKLSNYFFGLTSLSFPAFVGATFCGLIPFSVHNVYLGTVAARLTAARAHGAGTAGPYEWLIWTCGLLLVIAILVYLQRLAWRLLDAPAATSDVADAEGG